MKFLDKLYPFKGKTLAIGDLNYHYLDEGKGHPVIMVHGNPTWSFFYREVIKSLRDDYRCIAVDHIGCGLSSKPQKYDYTLENHIKNIAHLIDTLKLDSFDLIIHDWGGAIGMGLACRFKNKVRRIIAMNTAAFTFPHIPKRINVCRTPIFGKIAIQGFNLFAKAATKMTTVKPLSKEVIEGFLYPYNNYNNRCAIYEFVQDIPLNENHRSWSALKSIEENLSDFSDEQFCFIWGTKDWCFDIKFLNHWKELFPKAQIHLYDDAGHYLLEDKGVEIIHNIKSFLAK